MRRNPLAALLRLRAARERRARRELGDAHGAEAAARAHLEALRSRPGQIPPVGEILRPAQLRALRLQGVRSEELLRKAAGQHAAARRRVDDAAAEWRRRDGEREAAARIEAERRLQAADTARRASERSLDDLMALLHDARKGKR